MENYQMQFYISEKDNTYQDLEFSSPLRALLIISLSIFICEILVMIFLHFFPVQTTWLEWFIDALLLLILVLPTFYFFVFAPLNQAFKSQLNYQKKIRENEIRWKTVFQTSPDAIIITRIDDGLITAVNNGFSEITGYSSKEAIGHTTIELNLWKNIEDRQAMIEKIIKNKILYNYEIYLKTKNNDIFCSLLSARIINIENRDYILSVIRNIENIKRIEKEIKSINSILKVANESNDIKIFLKKISMEMAGFMSCNAISTIVLSEDKKYKFANHLVYIESSITKKNLQSIENSLKDIFSVIENTKSLEKLRNVYPISLSQIANDNQENFYLRLYDSYLNNGFNTVNIMPVYGEKQLIGILIIADEREDFTIDIFMNFIDHAVIQMGLAIERFILHEELKRFNQKLVDTVEERTEQLLIINESLKKEIDKKNQYEKGLLHYQKKMKNLTLKLLNTRETERKIMAVELHDSIGHNLVLLRMKINDIKKDYLIDTAIIEPILGQINEMIQEVRTMSFSLCPPSLSSLGIGSALEELCEKIMEENDIQVLFVASSLPSDIDEKVCFLVYTTARELIFNVIKHAHAKKIVVHIIQSNGFLSLIIQDDGVGFDALRIYHQTGPIDELGGFGLFSIRERLTGIGGKMNLNSTLGVGTIVRVDVPVKRQSLSNKEFRHEKNIDR